MTTGSIGTLAAAESISALANATIEVDDLLNAAEATAAVPVTITLGQGDTRIASAKIGDTDLTLTDGVYSFDATQLADGTYTITVVTDDGAGGQATTTMREITIDRVAPNAPTVTLAHDTGTDGDLLTNNGALTVTAEDGATVEYLVDDGEWSTDYNPGDLADGQHTVAVRVKDAAGNASDAVEITFTLDTTAPADAGIDVDDVLNQGEATAAVPVTIIASADAMIVSAKIGDTDLTLTGTAGAYTFDATGLEDGEYTITVVTKDAAGNEKTTLQVVTIDRVAPATPTVSLAHDTGTDGDLLTSNGALTVGAEEGATVEYSLDGGATWSATYDPIGLAEGEHRVKVRVTDAAGNMSGESAELVFTLDRVAPDAPTVTLANDTGTADNDGITRDGALTVEGVETGATVEYSLDDGITWSTEYNPGDLTDGDYTVKVRVKDAAGNESAPASVSFTLDRTPPADAGIAVDTHLNGTEATAAVAVAVTPAADATIVSAKIGDVDLAATATAGAYTFDSTGLADGEYTITIVTKDLAGNEKTTTKVIAIDAVNDSTPTDIKITQGGLVAEKAPVGTEFATLSATDADAGDTFTYALVDENGDEIQDPFFAISGSKIKVKAALNDAQVGLHELRVKVTDAVGHTFVKAITVGVYNTEEAPENVDLTLAPQPLKELVQNGTVVGDLSATDQDAGDHVTFRLVDDAGGRFDIVNGQLVVKNGLKLDYEQARSHTVTVEAKDQSGLVTLKTFTIDLGDVNPEVVNGTAANETFFGGAGNDILSGGGGKDMLKGGSRQRYAGRRPGERRADRWCRQGLLRVQHHVEQDPQCGHHP